MGLCVPLLLVAVILAVGVSGVNHKKFRSCEDTAFCQRSRGNGVGGPFALVADSLAFDSATSTLTADVRSHSYPDQPLLKLHIQVLVNQVVRVTVDESPSERRPRYRVADVLQAEGVVPLRTASVDLTKAKDFGVVTITVSEQRSLIVRLDPFIVELSVDGQVVLSTNTRGQMGFEVRRDRNPRPEDVAEGATGTSAFPYDEDGMWEESFDGHTDQKRDGPSLVSMDVSLRGVKHVFGIPEHAADFSLPTTRGPESTFSQPYRLYNLDVFEYELDSTMALYGSIPFVIGHKLGVTSGVLWLNAAETYIDVENNAEGEKSLQWLSETGVLDVFLFASTTPKSVLTQYATLTGFPSMPPRFAIAYHQCRWNYKDEADVSAVHDGFDKHDIPFDVLWLDIEHTDGKRYFTWHPTDFPTPTEMQQGLAAKGRQMVTIVDPHIKRVDDYSVHTQALQSGFYVNRADGTVFDGWCWPGTSSYLDFTRADVREFWAGLFSFDVYKGSTPNLFTWIDMNEPSVFSGPELTMPKDCLHGGEVEHRDVHNQYGFYDQMATFQGQLQRSSNMARPFVLSRAFFAGSQKYGAVWTGDNAAEWSHLQASMPMLLSMGSAGLPFVGADIGGFFKNPDIELLVRWYQAGAFQPFMRAHAHIESRRREPWLFGEENTALIREAVRRRYAILPYLYTVFWQMATEGIQVMRPMWMEFPDDENLFAEQEQFMLGEALLIRPVTMPGETDVIVRLPGNSPWYVEGLGGLSLEPQQSVSISAPLSQIPVLQRGGTIIAKQMRARRNSQLMINDPYTLVIALDKDGDAQGSLFLDDGVSFAFQQGGYLLRRFRMENGGQVLRGFGTDSPTGFSINNSVERIVVMGQSLKLASVSVGDRAVSFVQTHSPDMITLRKPNVGIASDFTINFRFEGEVSQA